MYSKLITQTTLPWGATVLSAAFPVHGTVSFVGSIAGGSRMAGTEELAKIHAAMLAEGTAKRTKKDIQLFLDDIGASLSFGSSNDRLVFAGRVSEKNLHKLFAFVAEALLEPSFPARELTVLKQREQSNLALEAQDTRTQASIALSRALFSPEHPNYAHTTDESLAILSSITRKTLVAFHESILSRKTLIVSIAGDITLERAAKLVDQKFKKLPAREVTLPEFAPSEAAEAKREIVALPHKASIDYMTGIALGITSDHADYAALMLGMQVLGNPRGFTGRLMKTVREEEGLTDGVYASMPGISAKTDGYAMVWGTFAPALFPQGRAAIRREIEKIVDKGVTDAEVKKHRELYDAYTRVQLADSASLAQVGHNLAAQGRTAAYLDRFTKTVLSLDSKHIRAALKTYLKPELFSEAAAGPIEKNALAS